MKPFDHGGNIFAIARALELSPEELIDFSASINPLGPAPGVRTALAATFDRLVHYPDSDSAEFREALALHHGLPAKTICVGNGSTELIYLIPRLVEGTRALIIAPPFSEYAKAFVRDGWETDYFTLAPGDGFALPLERLAEFLDRGGDLVILGNPGNPTGRLYTPVETAALYSLCRDRGVFLVLDEAFMDFCEEGSAKRLAAEEEGLLVLRSMTKFYALPGLRLGYAIASHGTIARLAGMREPWSVNTFAQVAGIASLDDQGYAVATREFIDTERQHLMEGLAAIPGLTPYPSAANYILVEIGQGLSASELAGRLLHQRLLIRECGNFRGLNERFFRVAVRSREENARLLSHLTALATVN